MNSPNLQGIPGVGISGPLVDTQGFPRADLDLYQVRQQRHRVNCLQNDHKAKMKEIEILLHRLHDQQAQETSMLKSSKPPSQDNASSTTTAAAVSSSVAQLSMSTPFARIEQVMDGSPAYESGLLSDDLIIKFGDVNSNNSSRDLQALATVVKNNIGKPIIVEVLRNGQRIDPINITPHAWSGAGVVGCRFMPI